MLSHNELKLLKNLSRKKYREISGVYLIEGIKGVEEALHYAPEYVQFVIYSEPLPLQIPTGIKKYKLEEHQLQKISNLSTPPRVAAKMSMPKKSEFKLPFGTTFYLDDIRDPGNMGTIIRTSDWFGYTTLLLSNTCVDIYNPKVVQATMGSLHRVNIYKEGEDFVLSDIPIEYVRLATSMDGVDYSKVDKNRSAIVFIGNESNGISEGIKSQASEQITIPRRGLAESLNASISHAIIAAHFAS